MGLNAKDQGRDLISFPLFAQSSAPASVSEALELEGNLLRIPRRSDFRGLVRAA